VDHRPPTPHRRVERRIVQRSTYYISRGIYLVGPPPLIQTFRCRDTERLFRREPVPRFAHIAAVAHRRFLALQFAQASKDARIPPGHQLEALSGDRRGQHSIRINDEYRVCFTWKKGHAYDVEITKHYR
jgi:proteic killer suppression protein